MLEPIILFVRDEIAKPSIGPKYTKYLPYLLTLAILLLFGQKNRYAAPAGLAAVFQRTG